MVARKERREAVDDGRKRVGHGREADLRREADKLFCEVGSGGVVGIRWASKEGQTEKTLERERGFVDVGEKKEPSTHLERDVQRLEKAPGRDAEHE